MDDFLHNLRSGKLKQPDRGRRDYSDYKGPQRRAGSERRRTDYYAKVTTENFAMIKEALDALADYQKRIADALETIAAAMGHRRQEGGLPEAQRKSQPGTDEEIANRKTPTASAASQPVAATEQNKLSVKDKPELLKLIAAMRNDGHSWEKIARDFDGRDIATVSGKGKWRGPAIKKFWEANS